MRSISKLMFVVVASTAGLYAGCGADDESDNQQADADAGTMTDGEAESCEKKPPSKPAKHACWHVCKETPIEVDAASEGSAQVPTVQFGKTYTVTLNEGGNEQYTGTVRFDAAEEGREAVAEGESKPIHFHTVYDVPMEAAVAGTSDASQPTDSGSYQCDQGLEYNKVFDMEADSYDVTLGPTDRATVTLVVIPLNGPASN